MQDLIGVCTRILKNQSKLDWNIEDVRDLLIWAFPRYAERFMEIVESDDPNNNEDSIAVRIMIKQLDLGRRRQEENEPPPTKKQEAEFVEKSAKTPQAKPPPVKKPKDAFVDDSATTPQAKYAQPPPPMLSDDEDDEKQTEV